MQRIDLSLARQQNLLLKTALIILFGVFIFSTDVKAQRSIRRFRIWDVTTHTYQNDADHSFVPTYIRPAKYTFYSKIKFWRYLVDEDCCLHQGDLSVHPHLKLVNKTLPHVLDASDARKYIQAITDYDNPEDLGSWGGSLEKKYLKGYLTYLKFKEEFYQDKINEYQLEIGMCVSNACTKGKSVQAEEPLILKPLKLSAAIIRSDNGCSNVIRVQLQTPGNKGTNISYLTYSGAAKNALFEPPTSKKIPDNQDLVEFDIPLSNLYADKSQNLEILAYQPGFLPARAILSIDPASGLNISAGNYDKAKNIIPLTIKIPDCHKNNLYPRSVDLVFSGSGKEELLNPGKQTISIPARTSQKTFDLQLKSGDRCPKTLFISASSAEFGNRSDLDIKLDLNRTIKLNATYHPQKGNRKEHITLQSNGLLCDQEESEELTLTYPDGQSDLIAPPTSLTLAKTNRSFNIYIKRNKNNCVSKQVKINVSANRFIDNALLSVELPPLAKKNLKFSIKPTR